MKRTAALTVVVLLAVGACQFTESRFLLALYLIAAVLCWLSICMIARKGK